VPVDIEESAMIDGASLGRIIATIVVPTALPGIITSAVFSFTLTWNEFIFALITSKQNGSPCPSPWWRSDRTRRPVGADGGGRHDHRAAHVPAVDDGAKTIHQSLTQGSVR
jgi:hypothetical protein